MKITGPLKEIRLNNRNLIEFWIFSIVDLSFKKKILENLLWEVNYGSAMLIEKKLQDIVFLKLKTILFYSFAVHMKICFTLC